MPKIVILGSCRYEPYQVLFMPNKLDKKLYESDHEKAYLEACKVIYPAIAEADIVIAYCPDGIGEHTKRDLKYAGRLRKKIVIIGSSEEWKRQRRKERKKKKRKKRHRKP